VFDSDEGKLNETDRMGSVSSVFLLSKSGDNDGDDDNDGDGDGDGDDHESV
jgi:hypothetical protein